MPHQKPLSLYQMLLMKPKASEKPALGCAKTSKRKGSTVATPKEKYKDIRKYLARKGGED